MAALVPSLPRQIQQAAFAVNPTVPRNLASNLVCVPDEALRNRVHIMAEAGAGKSRFLGRILGYLLFLRGVPQIILDPTGGTIDNLFDRIMRLPREQQEQLWPRVRYVDMSGKGGYVTPFPLYYRLSPDDSLLSISQRFPDVIRRMDVHLDKAPIMGLNALLTASTYAGMVLATLGYQITEAPSLLRHPERWEGRLEKALSLSPEVQPAVEFFRDYANWKPSARERQSKTFLTKILPFIADAAMRAMFGASEPGFAWDELVKERITVCLDFRRELDPERKRFKLLWCFRSLGDYFKLRGFSGREQPISFIIDEVTQLLGFGTYEHSVMAEDVEELASVVARNYGVYLTVAHQNLPQINSERIRKALMTMGTQMIGVQTDPHSAQLLAESFYQYNPYEIKRLERIWMGDGLGGAYVVDHRPVDFTPEEQNLLNSYKVMDLGKFQFLVRAPQREGELRVPLRRVSIARFDRGLYPNAEWIDRACKQLMRRDGRPVKEVLSQIQSRRQCRVGTSAPRALESADRPRFRVE